MSEVSQLPNSNDEFWDGEKHKQVSKPVKICKTHTEENWKTHKGYTYDNGVIKCTRCSWGTRLPGYYRVLDGEVVDLRELDLRSAIR